MNARAMLIEQLIRDEGLRLTVYQDSLGIPTIGVGRNLRDKGLTKAEAMYLLDNDLDECVSDLASFPWFSKLDAVRQMVLVNMRFNLGPTKFRGFRRMLQALSEHDYPKAAESMQHSRWRDQVKGRADRLIRQMQTGEL